MDLRVGNTNLHFFSPQPDTSFAVRQQRATASCDVPVYAPAFAGTHCIYLQRDGQAELTWVADITWSTTDWHQHVATEPK